MSRPDAQRLEGYLQLITGKTGGIEALRTHLQGQAAAGVGTAAMTTMGVGTAAMPTAGPGTAARPAMGLGTEVVSSLAVSALEGLDMGRDLSEDQHLGLEAIINAEIRPAIPIVDGTYTVNHPLWNDILNDQGKRTKIEAAIPSIGRIELPGHASLPYGGTGFVVGRGLLMTNRHVAGIFAKGLGDRRLDFLPGAMAGIDFKQEQGRKTGPTFKVQRVVMIHPYWDMAILAVDGLPQGHEPLSLSVTDARGLAGRTIVVIGYPAYDPRNAQQDMWKLFQGVYGVKRLQPGELHEGFDVESFAKRVPAATHDCSTLGGNSGSAVIDLETGHVLALHFGGNYHERNYAVPSGALAQDGRVVQAGVTFAGTPSGGPNTWGAWWTRADAQEAAAGAAATADSPAAGGAVMDGQATGGGQTKGTGSVTAPASGGSVTFEIPLRITVSLGGPGQAASGRVTAEAVTETAQSLEAARMPEHDTDYASRKGYDPAFLFTRTPGEASPDAVAPADGEHLPRVPLPVAQNPAVLAVGTSGETVLRYQNFSVMMHAERRLALLTAANVTTEPELKRPEPGRDYSRDGLGGLGKNDRERWFPDPRLEARQQLPDVFFSKDRNSFDKGHLVRREDVTWGRTYALVRRANGDTFHVTNCSPQVATFNQAALGKDNWGDLENLVQSQAANERLCVFAGPVLDPADPVFMGVGDGGAVLQAKIPTRFWKVIVAAVAQGLAAYGFVLEQDTSKVLFEFTVAPEFVPFLCPIKDIAAMTGLEFDPSLLAADQFATVRGMEIGLRGGLRRKAAV
ncbi:MAG: DNA/RNA non-specific endonuclease [Solidesulfovibrio sp. DCME]|uniref:DNA/RNA non-specific endonuclease n=1 Tax=Solidesulfovibrio sp. DCME TaxID=3447380 RepID=UPI003D0B75EA